MKKSMPQSKTALVVGLGNPGEKFAHTPHNAGFLVVDRLLTDYRLQTTAHVKVKSEIAETKIGGKKIIFSRPQTFMNKSGEAVLALTKIYKLKAKSSLWVIHDDIDLALGQIKIVRNRGSAGHKGVEDIIRKLKTRDFVRFRIGTRPKRLPAHRAKTLMNTFVVSGLDDSEAKTFVRSIERCKEAILLAFKEGIEKTASIYNK